MVIVQKWPYIQKYFFGNIASENVFYDIVEQKKPFKAKKTRSSKSRKIDILLKGLTHGFGPKMAIFPTFFLANIGQENVFYKILEQKNAFLDYKNKKFIKSKIDIFPKGLNHGLGPKMSIFRSFFFRQYRPVNSLLGYFKT